MTDCSKYEPIFGAWYIKKKIGAGSFGEVYEIERKAEDTLEELIDYDLNIYEDFGR